MTKKQEFINQVVITPNLPLSEHLRHLILRRIWLGVYPVRELLPSTRTLAKELGVNRNTVSKVFQELRKEGWLVSIPGKGVMVVRRSGPGGIDSPPQIFAQWLEEVVGEAKAAGVPRDELVSLFEVSIATHYEGQVLKLAFVECSERDTIELSEELALATSMSVEPVLVTDLQEHAEAYAAFDLVATTFYHIGEVEEAFLPYDVSCPVIVLQINPVPELLLEVARLEPGKRVCIVTSNRRTAHTINHMLQVYNHALEVKMVIIEEGLSDLEELVEWAEIIVDSQSSHDFVLENAAGKKSLTVRFQIDRRSIEFFRDQTLARLHESSAAVPLGSPLPIHA